MTLPETSASSARVTGREERAVHQGASSPGPRETPRGGPRFALGALLAGAALATAARAAPAPGPAGPSAAPPRPVTVEDVMGLRSMVDLRISPDGEHVAYVVSTPSVERNEHEVALYVARAEGGGAPRRVGEAVRR